MKPASFAYHAPKSVSAALDLLGRLDDARILAGGQSLVPMLNMRLVIVDNLIDINGIDDLAFIREAGGEIEIGALTRQRAVMESPLVVRRLPILADALRWVGHLQTRNRGTIGGSLCHLDPSAELATLAALHDAVLVVESAGGRREVPFAQWPLAYMMPALEAGEMLTAVRFRPWAEGHGWSFMELARRHGDFAIVAVGVLLEGARDGSLGRVAIALGGVDVAPVRLVEAEQMLVGRPSSAEAIAEAAETARGAVSLSDAYVTNRYRQQVAAVLVARALAEAAGRLEREG